MPPAEPQKVRLDALDPKELGMFQQQLQEELQGLSSSSVAMQKAANELAQSGRAIERFRDRKQGQTLLLPLTESLYVSGSLDSADTVLVELGTGYYAEKDLEQGAEFFRRKVLLVKDNLDEIGKIAAEKQRIHEQVVAVLKRKGQAAPSAKP